MYRGHKVGQVGRPCDRLDGLVGFLVCSLVCFTGTELVDDRKDPPPPLVGQKARVRDGPDGSFSRVFTFRSGRGSPPGQISHAKHCRNGRINVLLTNPRETGRPTPRAFPTQAASAWCSSWAAGKAEPPPPTSNCREAFHSVPERPKHPHRT